MKSKQKIFFSILILAVGFFRIFFFVNFASAQVVVSSAGTKIDYTVGIFPRGVAFDNITNSVWVANASSATISKVNIITGAKVDYAVGVWPGGVVFDNVTNSVWVANGGSNTISKVDIMTGTRVDYAVVREPYSIAFDSTTNSVWVTNFTAKSVSKVDVVNGTRVDYGVGAYPSGVTFDNITNSVWVTNWGSNTVSKVDIFTGAKVDYATGPGPSGVTFDNITNSVWVVNYSSDTLSKINVFTGTKVDYTIGAYSLGIVFDSVNNSVWITNYSSGAVSKVNVTTGARIDYFIGSSHPYFIAFDNITNSVWVTNYGSNTVSKVSIGVPVVSPQPSQFWAQVSHTDGKLYIQQTVGTQNKPADDIIKTVPNDWVLKVATTTDSTGSPFELDGYKWYGVIDTTDDSTGWVIARNLVTGTEYLPYDANAQILLEAKATTTPYQTKETRTPIILQAVDNYYTQSNILNSLYGGGGGYDGLNNFQNFILGALYPKELVLAIAAHESAGTLNNEICASALDGGIGIMQITSEGFKGLGSSLKNYLKMSDCRANPATSKYYSNASQGIYANIKDGFRVLQEKYRKKCPTAQLTIGTLIYTCQDIERVLTTWAYNGKVLTGNYLRKISDSLRDLAIVFHGVTYANNDQLIEKLRIANANRIEFKKFSPVEIEVIDSQGRITGFDGTPIIREEIPFSRYDRDAGGGVIFFPQNPYTYRVIGTGTGTYGFRVEFTKDDVLHTFYATNIPIVPGEIHEYLIDWDALDRGERGVTVYIDTNGDGAAEHIVQSDGLLTEIVPPTIVIISPSNEYLFNATTTIQFTVSDASGIAVTSATLNGTSVVNNQLIKFAKPGKNTIEVSAMDNEGNNVIATSTFKVLYETNGFLPPIKNDGTGVYNQGRTLPVKFSIFDANNNSVAGITAHLYISKISDHVAVVDEIPLSTSSVDTGNKFRYDSIGKQYIFNLATNTMSQGTWQIKAVLDSGQEIRTSILLK